MIPIPDFQEFLIAPKQGVQCWPSGQSSVSGAGLSSAHDHQREIVVARCSRSEVLDGADDRKQRLART
jgi:hypothetical protein